MLSIIRGGCAERRENSAICFRFILISIWVIWISAKKRLVSGLFRGHAHRIISRAAIVRGARQRGGGGGGKAMKVYTAILKSRKEGFDNQ